MSYAIANREYKFYRFYYAIANVVFSLFCRIVPIGRENIPDGAALVCANHSNWSDPILIALAFTKKNFLHIMAKQELFRVPILKGILKQIGAFHVNRDGSDMGAVRKTLGYLKNGEKVCMFPEGTRVSHDNAVQAKVGAVRMAAKSDALIVPVYVPRKKRLFSKIPIVIGKPYKIDNDGKKMSQADYEQKSEELMTRISSLQAEANN